MVPVGVLQAQGRDDLLEAGAVPEPAGQVAVAHVVAAELSQEAEVQVGVARAGGLALHEPLAIRGVGEGELVEAHPGLDGEGVVAHGERAKRIGHLRVAPEGVRDGAREQRLAVGRAGRGHEVQRHLGLAVRGGHEAAHDARARAVVEPEAAELLEAVVRAPRVTVVRHAVAVEVRLEGVEDPVLVAVLVVEVRQAVAVEVRVRTQGRGGDRHLRSARRRPAQVHLGVPARLEVVHLDQVPAPGDPALGDRVLGPAAGCVLVDEQLPVDPQAHAVVARQVQGVGPRARRRRHRPAPAHGEPVAREADQGAPAPEVEVHLRIHAHGHAAPHRAVQVAGAEVLAHEPPPEPGLARIEQPVAVTIQAGLAVVRHAVPIAVEGQAGQDLVGVGDAVPVAVRHLARVRDAVPIAVVDGPQVRAGHDLARPPRRQPLQLDQAAHEVLHVLEAQVVPAPPHQLELAAVEVRGAGLPVVHDELAVDPQAPAVVVEQREGVDAGRGGEDRAGPAHAEEVARDLAGERRVQPEVEVHARIDPRLEGSAQVGVAEVLPHQALPRGLAAIGDLVLVAVHHRLTGVEHAVPVAVHARVLRDLVGVRQQVAVAVDLAAVRLAVAVHVGLLAAVPAVAAEGPQEPVPVAGADPADQVELHDPAAGEVVRDDGRGGRDPPGAEGLGLEVEPRRVGVAAHRVEPPDPHEERAPCGTDEGVGDVLVDPVAREPVEGLDGHAHEGLRIGGVAVAVGIAPERQGRGIAVGDRAPGDVHARDGLLALDDDVLREERDVVPPGPDRGVVLVVVVRVQVGNLRLALVGDPITLAVGGGAPADVLGVRDPVPVAVLRQGQARGGGLGDGRRR